MTDDLTPKDPSSDKPIPKKRDLARMSPKKRKAAIKALLDSNAETKEMRKELYSPASRMSGLQNAILGRVLPISRAHAEADILVKQGKAYNEGKNISKASMPDGVAPSPEALIAEEARLTEEFRQIAIKQGYDFDKGDGLCVPLDFNMDYVPKKYLGNVHRNRTAKEPMLVRNPNREDDDPGFALG